MNETTFPDRLSVNPRSPHFDEAVLSRPVGIKLNGAEKHNVEEYSISEGWIRLAVGKTVDRKGNPLTIKLSGTVEPFYKDEGTEEVPTIGGAGEAETEAHPS